TLTRRIRNRAVRRAGWIRVGRVKALASEDRKRPALLSPEDRIDAPPFSDQLRQAMHLRQVIDQSKVHVPRRIKVGRGVVLVHIVRILIIRKKIPTAVRRAGIKGSRPSVIQLSS